MENWKYDHGVLKRDLMFTPSGTTRTVHVYLPENYSVSGERYPVTYFFDGHNLFRDEDATYGKSWGLLRFLYNWPKQMIVVGVECSHEGNDRLKEYAPYHINNDFFGDLNGTGEETCRWVIDELKPLIDREFRTWAHREATGIAGSSMGGLMSLYASVRHNDVFSKAGCLSSTLGAFKGHLQKEIAAAALNEDTRVYMSWGTCEGNEQTGPNNRELAGMLDEKGILTRLYRQEGGHHCEADWEKQVPGFMNYLWLNQ